MDDIINYTDAGLLVEDGTPTTTLKYTEEHDEGGWQISGAGYLLNEAILAESRGDIKSVVPGKRKVPEFTLVARRKAFSDTSSGTLEDMVMGTTGTPYSARVFVDASTRYPNFNITITYTMADASTHTLVMEKVMLGENWDFGQAEGPGLVTYKAKILGRILLDGKVFAAAVNASRTP